MVGTEEFRGIQKYQVARRTKPHIGDTEAWTFGKEYGAIVLGDPMDIANITAVSAISLEIGIRAQWATRHVLDGIKQTEEDEKKLHATLEEHERSTLKLMENLSSLSTPRS
jgi:hypothetical protein